MRNSLPLPRSYGLANLKRTHFFESEITIDYGVGPSVAPGFFTPFSSAQKFRTQLKAPIAMPFLCVTAALGHVIHLIQSIGMTAIEFALFDFQKAGNAFSNVFDDTWSIGTCLLIGVVDALCESVALISRTLATIVSLGITVVEMTQQIFSSPPGENTLNNEQDSKYFSSQNPFRPR